MAGKQIDISRTFSSELALAVACAGWPPTAARDEQIRSLAARRIDWHRFLRVVDRHGVIGLVHEGISRADARLPAAVVELIEKQAAAQARINLTMTAESLRLQGLLDDAALEPLFLKGAALAVHAFGDLGLRAFKDIDILVPRTAIPMAIAVVERAGYRQIEPRPDLSTQRMKMILAHRRDLGFVHSRNGVYLELHWRLFLNPYAMSEDSLVINNVPISSNSALRTLGEADLFAYLCLHGAYHSWNQLKWLADVCALLSNRSGDEVEECYRSAVRKVGARAVGTAMLLCRRLFGVYLPGSVGQEIERDRAVRWLERTAIDTLRVGSGAEDPHYVRFGTTRGSISALLFGNGWRHCLEELKGLCINESDMVAVPLPPWLRFFYPVVRLPLWFWRHIRQISA